MITKIEVPVGGVIITYRFKMVSVADYKGKDVPLGGEVVVNGKRYVCEKAKCRFEEAGSYSCAGCGLYDYDCYKFVKCVATARADRTAVIYKEVE